MAACAVCNSLSKKQLKKFAAGYEEGDTPESLATTYSIAYEDTIHHCTVCLKSEDEDNGKSENLRGFFKSVKKLATLAETQYESQPDRSDLVHAFTALIGEARSILDDIDKTGDPVEVVTLTIKHALNPFIRKGVEVLAVGIAKAKTDLIASGAKPSVVEKSMETLLSSFGTQMKASRTDIADRLGRALGASKKDLAKIAGMGETPDTSRHN